MSRRPFVFCPYCGKPLHERLIGGHARPACVDCGFVQFPDPKVAVIAQIEDGARILLIKRAVNPARGLWALPGGYMDAGELPADAVAREVGEEVGLRAEAVELMEIFPMIVDGEAGSRGMVMAYRVSVAAGAEPQALDDAAEARWFAAAELPSELAFESTRHLLERWRDQVQTRRRPS